MTEPTLSPPVLPIDTPRALARAIAVAALNRKAADPVVLEVGEVVGYTEFFVLVSASNPRQVRAIAEGVKSDLKAQHGLISVGTEGMESAKWVLVDFDDVVLHVFHEGTRSFYDLETLWADAPRPDLDLPAPQRAPQPVFED